MKKIKVLRIINRFNIGGPTYNATFLTKFLGDEFETLLVGGLPEEDEADSLHIVQQYGVDPILLEQMKRNPNLSADYKAYKALRKIIRNFQPDIVHTHAAKAGALGRRAAKAEKIPVIVHTYHGHVFNGYFSPLKTTFFKKIERNLAKISSKIVAISPLQKDDLVFKHKICGAEKMTVVPLGFDLNRFHLNKDENRLKIRAQYNIDESEIAIGIIGRLAPIKNHDFFMDVLEQISQLTTKNIRVFIVGDGEERSNIEARIKNYNWPKQFKIELTSWVKDIAAFNPAMDIICLCSKNEGTPVSLIEAQAANIPVISTNVGGVSDVVCDKKTGIIVTSNKKEAYTEELLKLIEDEQHRIALGKEGWDFVKDNFHYTRLVTDIKELYLNLLSEKNAH